LEDESSLSVLLSQDNSKTPNISLKKPERRRSGSRKKNKENKSEKKKKNKSSIKIINKNNHKTKTTYNRPSPN
jgi:hypothetical protein